MRSESITAYGKPLETTERANPEPQGAEVLVRVTKCGVCHSDVHIHDGFFDLGNGNKLDGTRARELPFTLGHEIEGQVVALGPEATGVNEGDKVVVFPWIGCGECPVCASGNEHLCNRPRQLGVNIHGGFADHCLVPHCRYVLNYDGIPEGLAATYMCSGLTAYSALKKAGKLGPDDRILIVGLGGVGMMALQFALAMFDTPPLVADIDDAKLKAATDAGAGTAYNAGDPAVLKQIKKDTAGGPAVALDFVGAPSTMDLAVGAVRRGGTAIVVGLFGGAFSIPIPMIPIRAITITGSYVGTLEETKEMLELVKTGVVKPIPITERPLVEASKTLDDLRAGNVVGRVVLTP